MKIINKLLKKEFECKIIQWTSDISIWINNHCYFSFLFFLLKKEEEETMKLNLEITVK